MPFIAIGAAIFAGATIATVGIAAMSTLAIISAVGAIASGIGVITGNKALTQIGAVASLAGGVGAFAQGQGWLAGGVASGGADAAGTAMQAASDGAEAVSNTSQMIAQEAPGMVDPSANLAGTATAAADGTAGATSLAGDAASSSWGGEARGIMNSSPTAAAITEPLSQATDAAGTWGREVRTSGYTPTATSASIFDSFKGVGDFMTKNKDLTSMGMKFVRGMFDDSADKKLDLDKQKLGNDTRMTDSQIDFNLARTLNANAQTDIMKQQAANANAVPDLTGLKINPAVRIFNTGAPPAYNAPRAGLINSTGR